MVTYTWEKGPPGDWQVAGSLILALTLAVPDGVSVLVFELLQATTAKAIAVRKETVRMDCDTPPKQKYKNERFMDSSGQGSLVRRSVQGRYGRNETESSSVGRHRFRRLCLVRAQARKAGVGR